MLTAFRRLDALLRGDRGPTTGPRAEGIDFPLGLSVQMILGLGGAYGACMGLFALSSAAPGAWLQVPASLIKVPMLFLLTLLVTFPALYVFSGLAGSPLRFMALLRLLLGSIVVIVAVSASFAPILAFFTLSTGSYSFMVLLNVALLGVAGFIGLRFLRRTLLALMIAVEDLAPSPQQRANAALGIFRIWLILFGLVGAQMGWLLRPFIGRPGLAFTLFRPRYGSFFQSVFEHLLRLFGG